MTECALDEIYDFIGRFAGISNEAEKVAIACFVAHTHLIDAFRNTPRLVILSATGGCGKSTLLDVLRLLVPRPLALISPTPASLYALIEKEQPTLLIDQADTMFSKSNMSETVGIIDAGFTRGRQRTKVNTETGDVQYYNVFCPMVIAGIDRGNIDSAILDRSVIVTLQKNAGPNRQKLEVFREAKHEQDGIELKRRIEAWAAQTIDAARSHDTEMPNWIMNGRFADKWEPLFAVADIADRTYKTDNTQRTHRTWGQRVMDAALWYQKQDQETETPEYGVLVLEHLKEIFQEDPREFYPTDYLLTKLNRRDDWPWATYHNNSKELTGRGLAKLLKPFKVKPCQRDKVRGYVRLDFDDAFNRHLPPGGPEISVLSVSSVPTATDIRITPNMGCEEYCAARGKPAPQW